MEKRQYMQTRFSDNFEKINDEFVKCTISVNSYDQVANGTKFRKEAITKALPTLNYIPVIGYLKDDGTMGGHGVEYKITEDGFEEVLKTVPFGVVIKDSYRWEKLQKDNGEYEEYICVDVYLWSRYKDAVSIVKENKCNQSMEVLINNAEYSSEGYYDISDFNYSALCILGSDVAPAFNLAKIRTSDKFSKEDFKACYSEMTEALDKFLNFEEGGNKVEDFKKKRKCSECETEIEVEEEFDENEGFTCEECMAKKKRCENENDTPKTTVFELSFDSIREGLYQLIREKDSYSWVVEMYSDKFVYNRENWTNDNYENKYYRQGYSVVDDVVSLEGKPVEVYASFLTKDERDSLSYELDDLKVKFTDIQGELEEAKSNYATLEGEVISLREYKTNIEFETHKVEVDEELSKYSELDEIEGYKELIKDRYSCDLESLIKDIKIFAYDNGVIIGKKNTKKNFTKETIKVPVVNKDVEVKDSAWDILNKYIPNDK